MNRRRLGSLQEQKAVQYLQELGYAIEGKNYQTRFAEIDIVAREGKYLCFVEVKYRSGTEYGAPEGLITKQKMQRIGKAARFYLREKRISPDTPVRFDVVFILGEEISLIRNAFMYQGN